jgi:uncharacterized metal-binding protein
VSERQQEELRYAHSKVLTAVTLMINYSAEVALQAGHLNGVEVSVRWLLQFLFHVYEVYSILLKVCAI